MIALTNKCWVNFKDEHDGTIFIQHIGSKPKMYCCETDDRKAPKIGKGMDRKIFKNKLLIGGYLYTLTDNNKSYYTPNKICSKKTSSVFNYTIGLSNYDNKRYYIDNITSLPYGNYSVRQLRVAN